MTWLVLLWFLLNCLDAASTIWAVGYLGATELNPIMAAALARGFEWFLVSKALIVLAVIWTLYRIDRRRAQVILVGANIIYAGTVFWQAYWLTPLLLSP